jgi:hypothetical protein
MKWLMRILLATLWLLPTFCWSQELQFQLETRSITVTIDGWQPFEPWLGGLSFSNPEFEDIDGDGLFDMVVGAGGYFPSFINSGTTAQPFFSYFPAFTSGLQTNSWTAPELCDIDNDGDLDLFSTSNERVWFWENIGTPQTPQWQFITDSLEQVTWWATNLDLVDIDDDGDFDLFTGSGGFITYYINQGTPEQLNFNLITMAFEDINVSSRADPIFVDIDNDGDFDLFIGNRYGNVWFYRNVGDSVNYNFTYVTNNFNGIEVGDYASPEFADIDGDADYDLFVGKEANSANLIGDVYFYENVGTPQIPLFQLVTKNYLMLDMALIARPQLVDINADGRKELIAGTGNYLDYFENIGDSLQPEFVFVQSGFQGINLVDIAPFFVDIDADGDYDLITGTSSFGTPSIGLYLNQGTPRNPNLQLFSSQFVTNPNFFVWLLPVLEDIDADGDYDLFIFDSDDHFYYYQNDGTPQWPNFVYVMNQWQGIHQFPYPYNSWYGFSFADLDDDLDYDLIIGNPSSSHDNFYFYRNIGWPQSPQMILESTTFLDSSYYYAFIPYFTDIDSDGDHDLFVGHGHGGMMFFRNITGESPVHPDPKRPAPSYPVITLLPNPGNSSIAASYKLQAASQVSLKVFDITGRLTGTLFYGFQLPGTYSYTWDASHKASGVYILQLDTPNQKATQKITILK